MLAFLFAQAHAESYESSKWSRGGWRKIYETQGRGEWLRPHSFRDTFYIRANNFNISDTNIVQAMCHTVEFHHGSYRTSVWKIVPSAFEQVS